MKNIGDFIPDLIKKIHTKKLTKKVRGSIPGNLANNFYRQLPHYIVAMDKLMLTTEARFHYSGFLGLSYIIPQFIQFGKKSNYTITEIYEGYDDYTEKAIQIFRGAMTMHPFYVCLFSGYKRFYS